LEYLPTVEEEQVTLDQVTVVQGADLQMPTVAAMVAMVATAIEAVLVILGKIKVAEAQADILAMVAVVLITIQTITLLAPEAVVVVALTAALEKLAVVVAVA
jgi:hypothetical protein